MSVVNFTVDGRNRSAHLTSGDSTEAVLSGNPLTVSIIPDEGGGAGICDYSTSSRSSVRAGSAKWIPWALGEITEAASAVTEGTITAIRVRCTSGDITVEVQ